MDRDARGDHTVLIVDDDSSLRGAVAANVHVAGYRVREAADGVQALAELNAHPEIDLVICDIIMPKMNGADFIAQARALRPDLPFIMITGYSATDLMTKSLSHGAYTVLSKPFDPRTLLTIVKRAITAPVVLIVDSEKDARSVAAILEASRVRTRVTCTVEEAADALRGNHFDVVIIEAGFSQMDPLRELMKSRPELRVIGLVGADVAGKGAVPPGLFTYLRKPIDSERLMHVLATARATP